MTNSLSTVKEALLGILREFDEGESESMPEIIAVRKALTALQKYERVNGCKRWVSTLERMPHDNWLGTICVVSADEEWASYTTSKIEWRNGKWHYHGGSNIAPYEGMIVTHWLENPNIYPPLPDGWPDIDISVVNEWLAPYRAAQPPKQGEAIITAYTSE